jgi:hypothetical protein
MKAERVNPENLVAPTCWAVGFTWNDGCAKRRMFPQIEERLRNWRNHRAIGGRAEKIRGMVAQAGRMTEKIREMIPQTGAVVEKTRVMIDQNGVVFEKIGGMIAQAGVMIEKIGGMIPQTEVMNEKKGEMIAQVGKWLRRPGKGRASWEMAAQAGECLRKHGTMTQNRKISVIKIKRTREVNK